MARILCIVGLLTIGVMLGWVIGRVKTSEDQAKQPSTEIRERPSSQDNQHDAIVDLSGLPANQREVAEKLNVRAAYVRGSDLQGLETLLGTKPLKQGRLQRQIYLVVCLETRTNTGQRVMSVTLEIIEPVLLAGRTIRMAGHSCKMIASTMLNK